MQKVHLTKLNLGLGRMLYIFSPNMD